MTLYGIDPSALLLPPTQSIDITPALCGVPFDASPIRATR